MTPVPPPRPEDLVSTEQAAARFRFLRGRSVSFGFVPIGIVVKARTPDELAAMTAVEIARLMQGEPEN